jgi:CheY-like chemotaxis protein
MIEPLSILIAEDDDALRRTLEMLLLSSGHRIVAARDGAEALVALDGQPVDLVITDVLMPKMDGLEFIREIREHRPELPIVAISGGGKFVDGRYCLTAARAFGASAALAKPFGRDELNSAIDRAIPRGRAA